MGDQIAKGKLALFLYKIKPYLAMISLQFGYAGMYIISMVGLKRGMSHFVLAVYRHLIAVVVIAPFALVLERKIRPKLTLPIFLRIMVLGFLEPVFAQNLYFVGMTYTSATFASATANILPAITFIFALLFRLEKINFKKIPSVAKVIGTVITVMGAMVMTWYKGPIVEIIRGQTQSHNNTTALSTEQHWITGTFMLLARCCGWSGFFILQSFTLKLYPAELSLTALICLMGALEGAVATFILEHNMSVWVIGWDSRLLAAGYSGVVCSGIAYYVQGVVMKEQGPVFVTAFSPLAMIITAALAAIILAEQIHLGSILGTILIVIGLYAVVWGKSKDPTASSLLIEDEKVVALELPVTVDNKTDGTGPPGDFIKVPIKAQESC
ncbi:PREDICTED: WAT1-related [Prunus dulcis]|uniref:WAT1-related protein n=1 Tax=Prunus dulcis TaxID=3755 RepID=A0A5E4EFA0_PRUDU|nr:WAT1-related protein At1g21890-like [Prunus dulcis]VVA13620.1 PREDICTED: WAT1-related [Prunus dulcis]